MMTEKEVDAGLASLLSPRSVAVIGASRRPGSVGNSVFLNILRGGFTGVVYPVNPNANAVVGVKSYPSVLDAPDEVDQAVIIVPSKVVPEVLEQCGEKGVKGGVIISAGFRESGEEGARLEAEVKSIAERRGIRIIGPNCLGVINTDPEVAYNATFAKEMPSPGNIAFVSQSGALCVAVLDYAKGRKIGFSKFISFGNKSDVDENDLLRYLAHDEQTKVILMYLEDLVHGRSFIEIARQVSDMKPILAVKAGRTPAGAKAAASHTGSLAGSDEVYDAIFAQGGVLRVESVEELFDYAAAFANQPMPKGDKTAIVTNAGGPGIIATDASIRFGLELATLEDNTVKGLLGFLPPTASVHNPVDILGDADSARYEKALGTILGDRNVDSAVVICTRQAMVDVKEVANVIVSSAKISGKPVLVSMMGVVDVSEGVSILEENGIPDYVFPEAAVRSLWAMHRYQEWVERPRTEIKTFAVDRDKAKRVFDQARAEGRTYVPEIEGLEVLDAYGFPVPRFKLAVSEREAVEAAERLGYPVVAKIASPDILHKVDVGGVALGLTSDHDVRRAYREMLQRVKRLRPDARILGVNIQEQVSGGKETILGVKRDSQFGPLLMFGLGGIYVEVFRDVAFRLAPIRELSAEKMIKSTKASSILYGVRGEKASDVKALIECILRLSQLATDFEEIMELDINPLVALEEGKGCKVLDARVVISK